MEKSNGYPHTEPRGRKAYLKQYVPDRTHPAPAHQDARLFRWPSGEPARLDAGKPAAKPVAAGEPVALFVATGRTVIAMDVEAFNVG
jgi:hypothetical protein